VALGAAAAAALATGASVESLAAGLATARLSPLRMALGRAPSGAIVLNDAYNANPASMAAALQALGFERTVLVVTGETDAAVKASAHNLQKVTLLPAAYLNVADMLSSHGLLMTVEAVRSAEALWGGERATTRVAATQGVAPKAEA